MPELKEYPARRWIFLVVELADGSTKGSQGAAVDADNLFNLHPLDVPRASLPAESLAPHDLGVAARAPLAYAAPAIWGVGGFRPSTRMYPQSRLDVSLAQGPREYADQD